MEKLSKEKKISIFYEIFNFLFFIFLVKQFSRIYRERDFSRFLILSRQNSFKRQFNLIAYINYPSFHPKFDELNILSFLHHCSSLLPSHYYLSVFRNELRITRNEQTLLVVRSTIVIITLSVCCPRPQFNSSLCLESMLNDFHE